MTYYFSVSLPNMICNLCMGHTGKNFLTYGSDHKKNRDGTENFAGPNNTIVDVAQNNVMAGQHTLCNTYYF